VVRLSKTALPVIFYGCKTREKTCSFESAEYVDYLDCNNHGMLELQGALSEFPLKCEQTEHGANSPVGFLFFKGGAAF
jgi:hypothetical protein